MKDTLIWERDTLSVTERVRDEVPDIPIIYLIEDTFSKRVIYIRKSDLMEVMERIKE